jgi:hypothetical protein
MSTKHICGGAKWGKLASEGECARCDELRDGDGPSAYEIRDHVQSPEHRSGQCGIVCPFGDW